MCEEFELFVFIRYFIHCVFNLKLSISKVTDILCMHYVLSAWSDFAPSFLTFFASLLLSRLA